MYWCKSQFTEWGKSQEKNQSDYIIMLGVNQIMNRLWRGAMRLVTPWLLLCLVLEGGSKEPRSRRKEKEPGAESPAQGANGCQFPDDMRGSWFLGGSRKDFVIRKKQFGLGAWCYRLQDDQRWDCPVQYNNDTSPSCPDYWSSMSSTITNMSVFMVI